MALEDNQAKQGDRMRVTVKQIGSSLAVVIPRAIAAESRLEEGIPLEVSSTAAGILFRRPGRRQRRRIGDLAKRIDPSSYEKRKAKLPADSPVGGEVW
jgi:antitoxin component of MazEF toxin-antitoxin module